MTISKTVCGACGADNAPEGARFCPSCGASLLTGEEEVPMAAATPLNQSATATISVTAESVVAEASTVTFDEPEIPVQAAPSAPPQYQDEQHHAAATAAPQNNNGDDGGGDVHCANYFLNPTTEMLERAQSMAMGGILFISTSDPKGKFTVAKEIGAGCILGGNRLDLSYADFVHPVTTVTGGTALGGIKVIVPRGVRVETRGIGILGGFKGLSGQTVHAAQEAPLVIVQGLSVLGGVKVELNESAPPLRIIK